MNKILMIIIVCAVLLGSIFTFMYFNNESDVLQIDNDLWLEQNADKFENIDLLFECLGKTDKYFNNMFNIYMECAQHECIMFDEILEEEEMIVCYDKCAKVLEYNYDEAISKPEFRLCVESIEL